MNIKYKRIVVHISSDLKLTRQVSCSAGIVIAICYGWWLIVIIRMTLLCSVVVK